MSIGETRPDLIDQALRTLYSNTIYPHKLYIFGDNISPHHHIQVKNEIIKKLKGYDFLVLVDDDCYFNNGWLEVLINAHNINPDIDIIEATSHFNEQILEEREDIVITDKLSGPCIVFKKRTIDKMSQIPIRRVWTKGIDDKFKSGRLKDQTKVVHCGVTRSDGYRYDLNVIKFFKDLAEKVGAITR